MKITHTGRSVVVIREDGTVGCSVGSLIREGRRGNLAGWFSPDEQGYYNPKMVAEMLVLGLVGTQGDFDFSSTVC